MRKVVKVLIILPVIWLALAGLSIVLYLLTFLPRFFSGRYYHFLSRVWCKIFVHALDVDLKLVHKNRNPLPRHYILIANHPSALEDFGVPALFDIYPLAKAGVRDWIILGRISDYAGTIYVKRGSADSRKSAKQALANAVSSGKNIVIFPEGGCKGARIYEKFHTGAFEISMQSGIPILPVFLQYIDQQAFTWAGQTLVQKLWQIFRAGNNEVNYYVHDAIYPDAFADKESYAKYAHSLFLDWQKDYLDPLDQVN